MEDERGAYYLVKPGETRARVYVRRGESGEIEFRLWERDHPEIWDNHGWLPLSVIRRAADLYKRERDASADPAGVYDEVIARNLLRGK